jgi:hypothetical protein
MKKTIVYTLTLISIALSLNSCSKSGGNVKPLKDSTTTVTGKPGTTDVYVAGYEDNAQNQLVAVYWKNGTEVKLPGESSDKCMAKAIFVSGNDVYVAGYTGSQACYWKNGVLFSLPSQLDTLQATSIYAANGNVYVTMSQQVIYEGQKTHPGEFVVINSSGGQTGHGLGIGLQTQQTGISVSGTDVYTSGSFRQIAGTDFGFQYFLPQAYYWKNGSPVFLPLLPSFSTTLAQQGAVLFSSAFAIAVSGNDVYTAGAAGWAEQNDNVSGTRYPAYWKNKTPYMLGEQTVGNNIQTYPLGAASSICVSGSDVYVGGSVDNSITPSACYWKNNGPTVFMPRQGDFAEGSAIAVSGSDVYMAGTDYKEEPQETYTACYWKNGVEVTLPASASALSTGNGLFIVKH